MRRMMLDIPPKWKHLWDTWDLRGFLVLSLVLQMFLTLLAPLRKRTSSNWLIIPLWSAYLLADWVANFSVGLITNSQEDSTSKNGGLVIDMEDDLLAFWAPFLLVHLGGPDTITAFALEDNEFWLRHLIGLVIQCLATVYVFVQSLPDNHLWIPTLLMFMNGTIKYAERTRAFYLASADRFKWSMNTNAADSGLDYMEENLPNETTMLSEAHEALKSALKNKKQHLTELEVVQCAYYLFNTFKGLVVDLIFSQSTRNESRDFFLNLAAKDAFEVVEVELNFIYEDLFTKIPVVYGYFGAICRFFSLVTVLSSIVLFIFKSKATFSPIDVTITYGLLFSALALDIAALVILLYSKRTAIFLLKSYRDGQEPLWIKILNVFHRNQSPIGFLKRRWSESIPTYNLIYYCLHPYSRLQQLAVNLGLSDIVDCNKYVKAKRFEDNLRDFIIDELKSKSENVDNLQKAMEISSSRGDFVLRDEGGWSRLLPYTLDADYGQRIILWHVATDLCYHKEINNQIKSRRHVNTKSNIDREIAKVLSDYMMYLLIIKPSMMSAVTSMVQGKISDVCADSRCIFKSGKIHQVNEVKQTTKRSGDIQVEWKQLNACMKIFDIPEEVWLRNVKGDLRKSLLHYSYALAKQIMTIEEEDKRLNKWSIISKVWVDLLCYGASHSQAKIQAAQVNSGGELITFVWLLMAHFGLGDQFQINQHQEKARIVVGE